MPWKVKSHAHKPEGRVRYETVAEADEFDDDFMRCVNYWVRNLEPGHKVVITRKKEK